MNGYRPTRAAAWLGTVLAKEPLFVTQILREGARLGFGEAVIRGAFAEIGATAKPGGQLWALDDAGAQFFRNWAAAHGAPAFVAGQEQVYFDFWKAAAANAPSAAVPAVTQKPAAPKKLAEGVPHPILDSSSMQRSYAKQREGGAERVAAQQRFYQQTYGDKVREANSTTTGAIDRRAIYERRKP
jgi:hypothetical protein